MHHYESPSITTDSSEAQDALPLQEDIQEQFDIIAKRLHASERTVFEAATERYDTARMQVGEKAIGQMGHQIRESEETSALMSGAAYLALNTNIVRKADDLWTVRDEVIDELMSEPIFTSTTKDSAIFAMTEIGKAADAFINDRIASIKDTSTQLLDTKVDTLLPRPTDAQDFEGVADIGKRDFDERVASKLDTLEALAAGLLPKHIGHKLLRQITGEPVPENPTTHFEIIAALRDFEVTVDAVRNRDGVNSTVRDSIRQYLAANGLTYPDKTDYQRVVNETLKETEHLYQEGATKEDLKRHLKVTTVAMLREMGYVKPEAEKPKSHTELREEAMKKKEESEKLDAQEADPAILQEIDTTIAELYGQGLTKKQVYRKLVRKYHPDTSGFPRSVFQHFESYFND